MIHSTLWHAAVLLTLLSCGPLALAQTVEDEFADDFPAEPLNYVGFGAGVTSTFIFMNLDRLNQLAESFDIDHFSGPLTVFGGNIIFTPAAIPNVRAGFAAMGGYHTASTPVTLGGVVYQRTLRFGIRLQAGLQADYAFPVSSKFTILPSLLLGWGSYSLELTQARQEPEDFGLVTAPQRWRPGLVFGPNELNRSLRLLNFHGFAHPAVHFEYAFTGILMLRGSAGYHVGFLGKTWQDDGGTEYSNVGDATADGPVVQVGLFLGLFQQ